MWKITTKNLIKFIKTRVLNACFIECTVYHSMFLIIMYMVNFSLLAVVHDMVKDHKKITNDGYIYLTGIKIKVKNSCQIM